MDRQTLNSSNCSPATIKRAMIRRSKASGEKRMEEERQRREDIMTVDYWLRLPGVSSLLNGETSSSDRLSPVIVRLPIPEKCPVAKIRWLWSLIRFWRMLEPDRMADFNELYRKYFLPISNVFTSCHSKIEPAQWQCCMISENISGESAFLTSNLMRFQGVFEVEYCRVRLS